jgi:hypothetical protein
VSRIVAENDMLVDVVAFENRVHALVFRVLLSAGLQTVNVLPRLRFRESEIVGCDAHDGAVLFVDGEDVVGEAAAGLGVGSWSAEGSPEEGTGVIAQRVKVEIVDGVGEDTADCLYKLSIDQLATHG